MRAWKRFDQWRHNVMSSAPAAQPSGGGEIHYRDPHLTGGGTLG